MSTECVMICSKCNQQMIKFGAYKCKTCRELYHLKWRMKNRYRVNELSKKWVNDNKEKRKQIVLKSEGKDKEAHLARRRKYYAEGRRRKDYKQNPIVKLAAKNRRRARLAQVIHEPYKSIDIFKRDNFKCKYCGNKATCLDHIIPISKGGADAAWNLNAACRACNTSKSNKLLTEWVRPTDSIT